MTLRGYTNYICDRCNVVRSVPDKTGRDWPDKWSRMMVTTPVLASPLEGVVVADWHLCEACTSAVTRNLGGPR